MRMVACAVGQALVLLALGIVVGLGANAARGKNHIDLTRAYFKARVPTATTPETAPAASSATAVARTTQAAPVGPASPYALVDAAEVYAITQDAGRAASELIIDARNDELFAKGHIPGAVQCDPYNLNLYLEAVLARALAAQRIIVYCHGGNCEDSFMLCDELVTHGILKEQLGVFKEGWDGWERYVKERAAEGTTAPAAPESTPVNEPNRPPANSAAEASAENEGFHEIGLAEAIELFRHPNTAQGVYVFVDARADDTFDAGHIPGAIQCDYYRIDYYFPDVLSKAATAEKIIVYCNGGECEDSLYVCGELLRADIPQARILLFKGGWQEWLTTDMPIEAHEE